MLRFKLRRPRLKTAAAHCDVPCGIYETDSLTTAAQTCQKLVSVASALAETGCQTPNDHNQFIRAINQKEVQAQICKDQIYILWSDYFKADDFAANPELHRQLWQAAKDCSQVKQTLDQKAADRLAASAQAIAELFAAVQAKRQAGS